jgi:hypothetical protein
MTRFVKVSAWLAALAVVLTAPAVRASGPGGEPATIDSIDRRVAEIERKFDQLLRDSKTRDDLAAVVLKLTEMQSELRDLRRDMDRLRTSVEVNRPNFGSSSSLKPEFSNGIRGRLRLNNSYPYPATFTVYGQSYFVLPGQTVMVEAPVGVVSVSIVTSRDRFEVQRQVFADREAIVNLFAVAP